MSWSIRTYNGTTETVRTPQYETITFKDSRERGEAYYRRECTTSFRFTGSDYTYLKNLIDTNYCGQLDLRLYYDGALKYTGQLRLRKNAQVDESNCWIDIVPALKDDYTTLFSNWEEEFNLLSSIGGVSLIEVSSLAGTIETTTVETEGAGPPDDPPGPASETWRVVSSVTEESAINQIWARETITVACSGGSPVSPGADWTLAEDNCPTDARYVRPVETYLISQSDTYVFEYGIVGVDSGNNAETYDNGRLFSEVIEYLADQAGSFTIVSDFFGINNDDTHPSNRAYTASDPNLFTLAIFQKSDIKRFDAAQNATILNITLKELLELLFDMFRVQFTVSGSTIRLEHESFFDGSNGEDLTSTAARDIAGFNQYGFIEEDTAPRVKFKWMDNDPKSSLDFVGRDILYDCADEELDADEVTVSQVSTDFSAIQANPENYQDAGMVFLALGESGGNYFIRKEAGALTAIARLNCHLSWANLHDQYHRHNRPQPTGTLNNASVTFDSVDPRKRGVPITITKSVDDYFSWDPSDKMKTGLGWGRVESAEYNSDDCSLTIVLLYD